MDKKTVFIKTAKGEREESSLPSDLKRIMLLIDGKSRADELAKRAPPSLREGWMDFLAELVEDDYIRDKNKPYAEPRIAAPKSSLLKMFTPKPSDDEPLEELDYSTPRAAPASNAAKPAKNQKADEAARIRAEMEAAVSVAKNRASAEAAAKAEAKARREAESAARAKALVDAEEAKMAEAKAKADARARAEIEAAARAQQVAEENAKREAEVARLKAEKEALRIQAEKEAAKARAEAEARAKAEALAKKIAEEKARQAAEAEARAQAEAQAKKVAEEKARKAAEAEAKARAEAEAERLKAEQAAARIRAEQEAAAKKRAEAEINAATEALSRQRTASDSEDFEINLDNFLGDAQQNAAPEGHYYGKQAGTGGKQEGSTGADARSRKDIAAEMERLKKEAEAARRKLEEEERRQAEEKALSEEQSRAWEEAEQRATVQAAVEVKQATQQAAIQQAKSAQTPVARKHRKPLPLGKITFVLSALALIVAVALPYVYPMDEYIAPLEQRLSVLMKQPVRIGGMSAASIPPTLKLQNVVMGNRQEVKVGNIKLNFDVFSLFSEIKIISDAELENVSIQGKYFDKQIDSLKLMGGDAEYPVRHLTLQRLYIVTDEITLPVLSGIADLGAQGAFFRVSLHSADDKLDIDLQSSLDAPWQVSFSLRESSLPILPDIVFSDMSAKGSLDDGEIDFSEMDAHIFNGILLGKAKLKWNKGWQLYGNLEAKTFDLDKMFPDSHIEGEIFGDGTFSMSGSELSKLGDDPHLEGSFTVKSGTVNVDVVETARLLSQEHLVGGRTHFDKMTGSVQVKKHTTYFRRLKIGSEMLNMDGSFEVSRDNQLSGALNAEIKMRPGKNRLTLYGTLIEPRLRAGR